MNISSLYCNAGINVCSWGLYFLNKDKKDTGYIPIFHPNFFKTCQGTPQSNCSERKREKKKRKRERKKRKREGERG